ncbi:COP9 signalosome complex subunit 4 [Trichuris trichiura]|uniref:COP9 signalosome complex subunit 4 n=1 Tax=Trichuris trichiura TaxID=36087 RepID=A0A077Z923_TRITR|nr:COP9 signalosome complex subunit 4 [Trichuris trichiura]
MYRFALDMSIPFLKNFCGLHCTTSELLSVPRPKLELGIGTTFKSVEIGIVVGSVAIPFLQATLSRITDPESLKRGAFKGGLAGCYLGLLVGPLIALRRAQMMSNMEIYEEACLLSATSLAILTIGNMRGLLDTLGGILNSGMPFSQQESRLTSVLQDLLKEENRVDGLSEQLIAFCDALVGESVCLVVSRAILSDLIAKLPTFDQSVAQTISEVRMYLVDVAERNEDWLEAAQLLVKVPTDSGKRDNEAETLAHRYLRAADLYLKCGKDTEADQCVTKAKRCFTDSHPTDHMKMMITGTAANVLDTVGNFVMAAMRYYELSTMSCTPEQDRLTALSKAVRCTILAPVDPTRARMLTLLAKDERCEKLPTYLILKKMFLEQIIPHESLEEINNQLEQCFSESKGRKDISNLRNAVIEHNVLSASKVYDNISVNELARLLGTTSDQALLVVARMITEGRLEGAVDGLEGVVSFNTQDCLKLYGEYTKSVFEHVGVICESIFAAHPSWARKTMDSYMN